MNNRYLHQALSQRWTSLKRKLPIIFCATLACYGLYYLDHVKRRFDEEKVRPFLVDEAVKYRVGEKFKTNGGTENEWFQVADYITKQHTTAGDFVNKLVKRISQDAEVKEFAAQARFKECLNQPPASSTADAESKIDPAYRDACAEDYLKRTKEVYTAAQDRIANAYRFIKPGDLNDIKRALEADEFKRTGEPKPAGYVASALQPTLDDESGIHIIYQILRISLVVLIVFAFVSFVVLLLAALTLSEGIKTFTEQATSLVGPGGRSLPLVRGGALLSIAALGLGTAAVAGGAVSGLSGPTVVHDPAYVVKSHRRGDPGKGGKETAAITNSSNYDYRDTLYAYDDSNDIYNFLDDNSVASTGTPAASVVRVFPEVSVVPTKTGEGQVVVDPNLTTSIQTYLAGMSAVNQQILDKLDKLVPPPPKDDIKVANHVVDEPLLIKDAVKGPISESIVSLKTPLDSIKDATTALDLDNVQTTNLDKPIQPKGRSRLDRWFHGSDKYLVSKRSLAQLENMKKGRVARNDAEKRQLRAEADKDPRQKASAEDRIAELNWKSEADGLIIEAVKLLYLEGGKPTEEAKFLAALKDTLRDLVKKSSLTAQRQDDTLARLQYWRDTILTYTRID